MKVVVTGATGFLGRKTCERLARDGAFVTAIGRNQSLGKSLESKMIHFQPADLSTNTNLSTVFGGHDYVIHCAALSSPWGRYEDFFRANVVATQNVLTAAKRAGVRRVVHVSTPSLYIDHHDRLDVREDEPLPAKGVNYYAQTKRLAEECVDEAVQDGLEVVIIRPQGIVGDGDTAILPRLLRVAKKGFLPIIGDGENLVDLTYVDNVVDALVLALTSPSTTVGKRYNITNGEPVRLYDTIDEIFQRLGLTYSKKLLSFQKAYAIAAAMEFTHRNFLRWKEPLLTRYSVCALGLTRTLNIDAARRDLGYNPRVTMNEAMSKIVESLQ